MQTRIVFSKPCTQWFREHGQNVEFWFDKEANKMAFRPILGEDRNTYRVNLGKSQSYISAKAFLKFMGSPKDGLYVVQMEEAMLSIHLGAA